MATFTLPPTIRNACASMNPGDSRIFRFDQPLDVEDVAALITCLNQELANGERTYIVVGSRLFATVRCHQSLPR